MEYFVTVVVPILCVLVGFGLSEIAMLVRDKNGQAQRAKAIRRALRIESKRNYDALSLYVQTQPDEDPPAPSRGIWDGVISDLPMYLGESEIEDALAFYYALDEIVRVDRNDRGLMEILAQHFVKNHKPLFQDV